MSAEAFHLFISLMLLFREAIRAFVYYYVKENANVEMVEIKKIALTIFCPLHFARFLFIYLHIRIIFIYEGR